MADTLQPRERFLTAVVVGALDRPALGTVTSLATTEGMDLCGAAFPLAHHDPEAMATLAASTSLEIGFDMIFPVYSVVHEAAAVGAEVNWGSKSVMPTIAHPLWTEPGEIAIPDDFEERPPMAVVLEALRQLKAEYGATHAIVGKVFGPWSLGFHLFGVEQILLRTIDDPEGLDAIFTALREVTLRSAIAQVKAGADVLCLGDHCSRDMCSPATYRRFLQPQHAALAREAPCPLVLHTCGDTSDRIPAFAETGLPCFHFDTRVPAAEAARLAGGRMTLMGGVSNLAGLLGGDPAVIRAEVASAVAAGVRVIGPECAVPLNAPLASLQAIAPALEAAFG